VSVPRRPIRKLLVANRGEIARRILRCCRERGIASVAVFSDADREAPFVAEADEAVRIGGASAASSYLRGEAVVAAARRTGADAIHPGYGFLSEDAAFGKLCEDAGLAFIGPPPAVLASLGSKIEAKRIAVEAGVPVLPGGMLTGDAATDDRVAAEIGFPVLVKASAGGGGRGMRVVESAQALERAVATARREAARGFGDDTVFLERYLAAPRHVEVQIFGDAHGDVVHLFERECSIQRRHQKILEESPSVAVDEALRERLGAAALAVARAVGYVGAGTVEFLLDGEGGFYFLEVNARLQVEHPVTEALTGLDLVALQLEVAEGAPLPEAARTPLREGHAIEVRLCAEDPAGGLLPTTGTVHRFAVPDVPGVRVDSGVVDGSVVGPHYDSMIAKVIAHGPTREVATARLATALRGLRVDGLRTNRDLLLGVLESDEFRRGITDTRFLERHPPAELARRTGGEGTDRLHALAAALLDQSERRAEAHVLPHVPSGWRNVPSVFQTESFRADGVTIEVEYRFVRGRLEARVNGETLEGVEARVLGPSRIELEVDGVLRRIEVERHGAHAYAQSSLGRSELEVVPRFAEVAAESASGSLCAPMPGTVVRVAAREGEIVEAGADLVVLEAMKMEHHIPAPHRGRVRAVRIRQGDTVAAGQVLVEIEPPEAEESGTAKESPKDAAKESPKDAPKESPKGSMDG